MCMIYVHLKVFSIHMSICAPEKRLAVLRDSIMMAADKLSIRNVEMSENAGITNLVRFVPQVLSQGTSISSVKETAVHLSTPSFWRLRISSPRTQPGRYRFASCKPSSLIARVNEAFLYFLRARAARLIESSGRGKSKETNELRYMISTHP